MTTRVEGLQSTSRELLKHSSIYGVGQVLSRLSSFLLLPVYTAYLSPAEYGLIALLDFTTSVLGTLASRGFVTAVRRYHFEAQDEAECDQVWWTGLTCLVALGSAVAIPAWLWRDTLAGLTLGPSQDLGGYYYTLVSATLWCGIVGELPTTYLRVRKWSSIFVGVVFARLVLNVGLNLYFLIVLDLGVAGILLGNLIAGGVKTTVVSMIFLWSRGRYGIRWRLVPEFWQFGGPIVVTALLSIFMHRADRYLLRLFLDLEQVGIYALAYTVARAIYTLFLIPFSAIWGVEMYEIAKRPNAEHIYVQVFQYFVYALMLIVLGASLFARPVLGLMVAPAYAEAADLVPIACLAYVFFSLHEHFKVPVFLHKRTLSLLPAYLVATGATISINVVLIPVLGTAGAAWTSVITFAVFSFVGLWRYRLIEQYDYPFRRCGAVLLGMVVSYAAYLVAGSFSLHSGWVLSIAMLIWVVWAIVLIGFSIRQLGVDKPSGLVRGDEALSE